jgi:hypothetical protein
MSAYSELQQAEFDNEEHGYTATRHQREVGTSYFDAVSNAIAGGHSSTTAMTSSTEAEQFQEHPTRVHHYNGNGVSYSRHETIDAYLENGVHRHLEHSETTTSFDTFSESYYSQLKQGYKEIEDFARGYE